MPSTYFSSTGENDALASLAVTGNSWISLHSSSPGTNGANEINGGSYARVQTTWGAAAGGASAGSQVSINVPASTTVAYFGIWTLVSSGTYIGGGPLPASETYTGAGTYLLTGTLTATG
jgi:hypothetical protein